MKRNLLNLFKFFTLSLLLLMSCDLANQSEFYVGFLSGTFNNWQHGNDKEIKMILETKESNQLIVIGSSRISADGSFSIDSLATPSREYLEPIGEGPGDNQDECTSRFEISDSTGMTVFASLAITNAGTNEIIGRAYSGSSQIYYDAPEPGNYIVEYIYSLNDLNVIGTETCVFNNNFTHTTEVIAYLNAGWNPLINETVSRDQNSEVKEISSGTPFDAEWFHDLDGDYNPEEYPFHLEGRLDFWDGSTDKVLVLGMDDFETGEIIKFTKADISANGEFSFAGAINPPPFMMMPITEGPAAPMECSINLTASDPSAMGASARFFIMDRETDAVLGEAGLGLDATNNGEIVVGNFFVEFIFSDRAVDVQGTVDCSNTGDNRFMADITNVDLSLSEGWNFASRVITSIIDNNISAEISVGILPDAVWYWKFMD